MRLSKGIRKYIREEKARIRRRGLKGDEYRTSLDELFARLRITRGTRAPETPPAVS